MSNNTEYTTAIKSIIESYDRTYIPIPDECLYNIFELYVNNKVNKVFHGVELLYYGIYYQQRKDHDNIKKYYLMAIENGNADSMNNYGFYCKQVKDYDNMKKYYLMAAERGNTEAMRHYMLYCDYTGDDGNMKNYYLTGIEKGRIAAMVDRGAYYKQIKDYINMKKYYLMAIEKGDTDTINSLKQYCHEEDDYMCLIELYYNKKMFTELIPLLSTILNKKKNINIDYTYILNMLSDIELSEDVPANLILLKHLFSVIIHL